jgi:hypothetical protein
MSDAALLLVFSWFFYQTVLCAAFYVAAFVSETSAAPTWQIAYWLVCLIGVNFYSMIVHQWYAQ